MNAVEVSNLNKIYHEGETNEFYALKNINLSIKSGDLVILKGVSGSGKSTLLSLIGGLSKPSSGEILINRQNVSKLPDIMASNIRHTQIGFVFQSFNLLEGLSVKDNVKAPLSILSLSKSQTEEMVQKAMQIANIAHKKDQNISSLSGGEKQRCAIARALVMEPSIILADEPTANLDKQNSLVFIQMLKKFKELKKTVIVATHDILFDDLDFVDEIVDVKNGEIL
ncbi:ABC transporter ATP-binding protein [Campylobacter sp. RM9344]|uniref:ABC transporter ATP-binding protein n=1 Tax=Campylobacter californiensis TaxID=1032243 RepID=A0AAW3ZWB7_9BACT|nr:MULTISPECIES: ABC transporter ATP-binding protein [unclassified Campylobacter]MBE2983813.1 ABC transporter ATP-binding protein [Campylobacter sp. RM6883]MBE2985623.1 ABC transporter ATP-binding protein [Campylobacter sp. RM12919]MBE2987348.1 ABC transporter ATP-binding protein [Campylobacter sp. RM12920]MBE2994351.1 ABC transporter ATP-binding protein [Campylobacter sp. RM6913]MBE3022189.1 ABC transporter ATP-binding protein [Campylobacter sp. 7477a]MBE3028659.1 ABC transporter ATP-binding